jgi:secondary thiamine-phosphate synthase enzyme
VWESKTLPGIIFKAFPVTERLFYMEFIMEKLSVKTRKHCEFIDVTPEIQEVIRKSGATSGVCQVFVPHTTAGITINENADPDVIRDILAELNKIVPLEDNYAHAEGNSAAHIKSSLVGCSQTVLIEGGRLALGTWQSLFFCEFDGPRTRSLWVKIL